MVAAAVALELARFLTLAACLVWVLVWRPPRELTLFLRAQLAATIALEPFVVGDSLGRAWTSSPAYLASWALATGLTLAFALRLTMAYVWLHPRAGRLLLGAVCWATFFVALSLASVPRLDLVAWTVLAVGWLTLLMAFALGLGAVEFLLLRMPRERVTIAITLSMLFFAEAGWDLVWPILNQLGLALAADLNAYLKMAAICVSMLWLGWSLQHNRQLRTQKAVETGQRGQGMLPGR